MSAPDGTSSSLPVTVSVWTYANVLLKRWSVVFGLPLAAGAITATLLLMSARQYTAFASFVPQDPVPVQVGLSQLASQLGLASARVSTSSPQFYADLLHSREVLRDIVTTSYAALGGKTLLDYLGIQSDSSNRAILRAIRRADEIYSVRTDRVTGVIRLEVHTKSESLSEEVANRFLQLVNEYNLKRRQSQGRQEREFVEERLSQSQILLAAAEDSLSTFYRHNRRLQDSPQLLAREARLQRQVALRQQLYVTLSQNYEAARIEEVRNTPLITVVESPNGLVAPRPRGTVVKVIVVVFLTFAAIAFAVYASDYLSRARVLAPEEYEEFVRLRSGVADDFSNLIRRPTIRRDRG